MLDYDRVGFAQGKLAEVKKLAGIPMEPAGVVGKKFRFIVLAKNYLELVQIEGTINGLFFSGSVLELHVSNVHVFFSEVECIRWIDGDKMWSIVVRNPPRSSGKSFGGILEILD